MPYVQSNRETRAFFLPEEKRKDSFGQFLSQVSRNPLLTAEQEIELGRKIQEWMTIAEQLPEDKDERASAIAELSESDRKVMRSGQRAKAKMVESNLKLVVWVAKKYQNRGISIEDLFQEGTLGLNRAAEKFDPEKGYKFSTYAYAWIRQAITRYIAQTNSDIRRPVHLCEKMNLIKKTKREISQTLGRTPSRRDIAEALELTVEQVEEVMGHFRPIASIDRRIGDDSNDETIARFLADDVDLWESVREAEILEKAHELLDCAEHDETLKEGLRINARDRRIIEYRFGFRGDKPLTFDQIAATENIGRQYANTIYRRTLRKLKGVAQRRFYQWS